MGIMRVDNQLNKLFDLGTRSNDIPRVHNKHHHNVPKDAVYIGRGSPWGNPFVIGRNGTRDEVIALFRDKVLPYLDVKPLQGKHLVCFCKPAQCHGDLLLAAANPVRVDP